MNDAQVVPDAAVIFTDDAGTSYACALPRLGHTNREVRAVAYRWACQKIADGDWQPYGELHYLRIERII